MFNFFERGVKVEVVSDDEENDAAGSKDGESVIERQATDPRSKSFIHKFATGSEKLPLETM